jgi:hypothetical protein
MDYAVKVSQKNLGASIHATTCSVVAGRGPREAVWHQSAESAETLRTAWDADNQTAERGLPKTKICPCCHA